MTSNKAWDEAHPAGTLLNDLIELSVLSYADHIDNGYQGEIGWEAKKLSEMTTEDFRLISPEFSFYFKKTPDVIENQGEVYVPGGTGLRNILYSDPQHQIGCNEKRPLIS